MPPRTPKVKPKPPTEKELENSAAAAAQRKAELEAAPDTLPAKLVAAIREVDHVDKDGFNKFHGYHYTSAEAIYRALREPLLSRGLLILPSAVEITQTTEDGSTASLVKLRIAIVDTVTNEAERFDWLGEGHDKGDKGPYKAFTGGLKTFLRHLFMLPADDDPEADETTDKVAAKRKGKGGAPLPSKAQKGLLEKVVKGLGFNATTYPTLETIMAWAESLTGGENGTMSKALDYVLDKEREKLKKVAAIREKTLSWAKTQSDLPGAESFDSEGTDIAAQEGFTEGNAAGADEARDAKQADREIRDEGGLWIAGDDEPLEGQESLLGDEDAKAADGADDLTAGPYDPEYP